MHSLFPPFNFSFFVSCSGQEKKKKEKETSGTFTLLTRAPVLTPLFPCSRRQIFLESWELSKTGPHTASEPSTAGGRRTHTHTHTLTKWRLWQKFPLPQELLMSLITTFFSHFLQISFVCVQRSLKSYKGNRELIPEFRLAFFQGLNDKQSH